MTSEEFFDALLNEETILIKVVQHIDKKTGVISDCGILKDNTAVLLGVSQKDSRGKRVELDEIDYMVPDSIEDEGKRYPVLYISGLSVCGESGYKNCYFLIKKIKSFNVPEGITTIVGPLFAFCNNLTQVTIPTSIKYIYELFWNCPNYEQQLGGQIRYLGTKTQWKDFLKNDGVNCNFGMDQTPWYEDELNIVFEG